MSSLDARAGPVYFLPVEVNGSVDNLKDTLERVADNFQDNNRQLGWGAKAVSNQQRKGIEVFLPLNVEARDPFDDFFDEILPKSTSPNNKADWHLEYGQAELRRIEGEKMPDSQKKKLEAEKENLRQQIDSLKEQLDEKNQKLGEKNDKIEELRADLQKEGGVKGNQRQKLQRLTEERDDLQEQVEELEEKLQIAPDPQEFESLKEELEDARSLNSTVEEHLESNYDHIVENEERVGIRVDGDRSLRDLEIANGSTEEEYISEYVDASVAQIEKVLELEERPREEQEVEQELEEVEEKIEMFERLLENPDEDEDTDYYREMLQKREEKRKKLEQELDAAGLTEIYEKVKDKAEEYDLNLEDAGELEEAIEESLEAIGDEIEIGIIEFEDRYSVLSPFQGGGAVSCTVTSYIRDAIEEKWGDEYGSEKEGNVAHFSIDKERADRGELVSQVDYAVSNSFLKDLTVNPVIKIKSGTAAPEPAGSDLAEEQVPDDKIEFLVENRAVNKGRLEALREEFGDQYDDFENMVEDVIRKGLYEDVPNVGPGTMQKIRDGMNEYEQHG